MIIINRIKLLVMLVGMSLDLTVCAKKMAPHRKSKTDSRVGAEEKKSSSEENAVSATCNKDTPRKYYECCIRLAQRPALKKQLRFRIVVPSRNNNKFGYVEKNIESIAYQLANYQNFELVYIDDDSTDGTGGRVEQLVDVLGLRSITTIIHNQERQGALKNIYQAVWSADSRTIIILLDGDDWLAHDQVLYDLNVLYQLEDIVLTYGQFGEFPLGSSGWLTKIPEDIIARGAYRQHSPHPSHLRTFYASLFQLIKIEDLLDVTGSFYPMTWDQAIMFPMCEMAGTHIRFIEQINYVYNIENPVNDNKVNAELQRELEREIRAKLPYDLLSEEQLRHMISLVRNNEEVAQ